MPTIAKTICNEPGCNVVCEGGRCAKHKTTQHTGTTKNRSGDPFYSSHRWKELRALKLLNDPLCECDDCKLNGSVTPADRVDHVLPRSERPDLELDYGNLRSMSESHHNRHTATQRNKARRGAG